MLTARSDGAGVGPSRSSALDVSGSSSSGSTPPPGTSNSIVSGSSSQPGPAAAGRSLPAALAGCSCGLAGTAAHDVNTFTWTGNTWSGSPVGSASLLTKNVSSNSHEPPGGRTVPTWQ